MKFLWDQSRTYTAARRDSVSANSEDEQAMASERNILHDEENSCSSKSLEGRETPLYRRSYSLPTVVALFSIGILIGGFVPTRINNPGSPVSFVPDIPLKSYIFREAPEFSSRTPDAGNASWDSLYPAGGGMVLVEEPDKYDLGQGLPSARGRNKYGVSVFHQIHCLQLIREQYLVQLGDFMGGSSHQTGETFSANHLRVHVEHCFDYLRQALMCCADTTVEWVTDDGAPTERPHVSGWEITHPKCKDWNLLREFMEQHQVPTT